MEFIKSYFEMLDLLKRVKPDNEEIAREIDLAIMKAHLVQEHSIDSITCVLTVVELKNIFNKLNFIEDIDEKMSIIDKMSKFIIKL